jgi:hypothetical protein
MNSSEAIEVIRRSLSTGLSPNERSEAAKALRVLALALEEQRVAAFDREFVPSCDTEGL